MNEQLLEYEQFFLPEQTVRIAFVAESYKLPEISGVVTSLYGDLLEILLATKWPSHSTVIDSGYLLELRSAHLGSAFRCRALLVSDTTDQSISVRLVGNVIFEELREYFRIDTYLPLRYIAMPDRDEKTVLRRWMELTEFQTQRVNNLDSFIFRGKPDSTAAPYTPLSMPLEYTTPVAANISGGGLRTNLPEQLQPGCKAILELYLPVKPPRIIEIVGEVLSSAYVHSEDGGKTFSTPFKFTHLNENDRDAIIKHIHFIQQRQIRQIAEEMHDDYQSPSVLTEDKPKFGQILIKSIMVIFSLLIALLLSNIYQHRGKSEVAIIFEKGLRMYIDKISPRKP
jgi:hypothetical protein